MKGTLVLTMKSTFWLLVTNLLQVVVLSSLLHDQETQLNDKHGLLNKPPVMTFQTIYGDVIDCVEINKQPAFDHPLLKNHKIQRKPSNKISKQTTLSDTSVSKLVPKSIGCPIGTIPIKRISREDFEMEKFSSFVAYPNDLPPGHQIATLVATVNNTGVSGEISLWSPDVAIDQLSDAAVFVASDDGSVTNAISAGWAVDPYLYPTSCHLFAYWTKDSGHTTGCFNVLCPGFVQISQTIYLGANLYPVSSYDGVQAYINITISQDQNTKNWWLVYGIDEYVGYWPKELFSTLTSGATRAGWGGEIGSSQGEEAPAMGSGHFPQEGFKKACIISNLRLMGHDTFPNGTDLKLAQSNPDCYKSLYAGDGGLEFGHYMFFGGPPNCNV